MNQSRILMSWFVERRNAQAHNPKCRIPPRHWLQNTFHSLSGESPVHTAALQDSAEKVNEWALWIMQSTFKLQAGRASESCQLPLGNQIHE